MPTGERRDTHHFLTAIVVRHHTRFEHGNEGHFAILEQWWHGWNFKFNDNSLYREPSILKYRVVHGFSSALDPQ
jgi:hypothetical protein